MKVIELHDIHFRYPDGTHALRGISMSVDAGSKVAVLGHNGSGKSTLFLLLNGLYRPLSGKYGFRGEEITHTKKQLRALVEGIGIVFQDPDVQLFAPTVRKEISIGPKNLRLDDDEVNARVIMAMEKTDISHLEQKPVHCLSYGEKKRVAIADILAMKSEILLLDEPFAWLDNIHEKQVLAILNSLSAEGKTIIMSTHSPDLAYEWADYIYIFSNGEIICGGAPGEVFTDKKSLAEAGLDTPFLLKLAEKLKLVRLPVNRNELLAMLEEI